MRELLPNITSTTCTSHLMVWRRLKPFLQHYSNTRCSWGASYLSGETKKWLAYGPADATATKSSLASLKSARGLHTRAEVNIHHADAHKCSKQKLIQWICLHYVLHIQALPSWHSVVPFQFSSSPVMSTTVQHTTSYTSTCMRYKRVYKYAKQIPSRVCILAAWQDFSNSELWSSSTQYTSTSNRTEHHHTIAV